MSPSQMNQLFKHFARSVISVSPCAQTLSRVQLTVTCELQPARLPHPWGFSGKNAGVGCHVLASPYILFTGYNLVTGATREVWEIQSFIPGNNAHSLNWGSISKKKERMNPGVSLKLVLPHISFINSSPVKKDKNIWDFPGSPVVKTLCFHCRGHTDLIPHQGIRIPDAFWCSQKVK